MLYSPTRLSGPDQDGVRCSFRPSYYVEHLVDAVTEVDISSSRSVKEDFRAFGSLVAESVAGPVIRCPVGFRFGDEYPGFNAIDEGNDFRTDELAGDEYGIGEGKDGGRVVL